MNPPFTPPSFNRIKDLFRRVSGKPEPAPDLGTRIVVSRIVPKSRMRRMELTEVPGIPSPAAAIVMTSRRKIAGVEEGPDCLVLEFADVAYEHPQAMTREQAREAAAFFLGHRGRGTIMVACDNGQARSAAMAAALLRSLGEDDGWIWDNPRFRPNQRVFALMAEALGVELADGEVEALVARNEEAFHMAMVRGREGEGGQGRLDTETDVIDGT